MSQCIGDKKVNLHWLHWKVHLHIALIGVNAFIQGLWCHPFHWQLLRVFWTVDIIIDLAHQPKIWHFHFFITANQDIASCKVTMNETVFGKMILAKPRNYGHQFYSLNDCKAKLYVILPDKCFYSSINGQRDISQVTYIQFANVKIDFGNS